MCGAAEIDHTAAVVADFEEEAGMVLAQLGMNVIVGADRVVAHIRGVRAFYPVGTPCPRHAFVPIPGWRMRMIAAIASLGDKVPIVLQHVEMIFVDNTLDFM